MWILYVLQFFISSALSQQILTFEYLRGVPRLDDSTFMDYYFSCRVIAPTHSYDINGSSIGFTGPENAGLVLQNTDTNLDNYVILLSKSPVGNNNYTYDTMLVVSTTAKNVALDITVRCFADSAFRTLTINDKEGAENFSNISRSSDIIFLQYLFSTNISEGTTTHVYVCGVNGTLQAWQAGDLVTLSFRTSEPIGHSVPEAVSSTVAPQTAIRYSPEPYLLTSLLCVTVPGAIDVRCGLSGAVSERVNGSEVLEAIAAAALLVTPPATETTSTPISPSNASSPLELSESTSPASSSTPTTSQTPSPGGCNLPCVLASAIATPLGTVLLFAVVVVVAILLRRFFCKMKNKIASRSQVNQPLSATPPDEVKDVPISQEDGVDSVV